MLNKIKAWFTGGDKGAVEAAEAEAGASAPAEPADVAEQEADTAGEPVEQGTDGGSTGTA